MKQRLTLIILMIIASLFITGCSLSISYFSDNINKAVKANNDPQTVMQALPTYLILMDGFIESDPEDEDMLLASSRLLNAYASLIGAELELISSKFEDDQYKYQREKLKQQQKKLTGKALKRAAEANCLYEDYLCNLTKIKYSEFEKRMEAIDEDDIATLYSLGTAWAAWLRTNTGDWNAMAQLPQIKLIMQKVITIDEKWDNAGAHMYLGVLNSLLPEALGGKPEQGKINFEAAIKITQGKNLMAKVLYAEYYARLTFNKALHQQLISDVLSFKETPHDFILMNVLAIQKAKALQISAEDYF
ncbi:MAG: TRAP transporter TatT component family protein [Methylococcales bacterium]